MRRPSPVVVFAASLALAFVPAVVGVLTGPGGGSAWYRALPKPGWTPPGWLFGPVWTVLYAAMGVAAALVFLRGEPPLRRRALGLHAAQLVANGAWTPVFFGLRAPGGGLAVIVVLLVLVALTTRAFWRAYRPAGLLLVPYLLWVAFATALNLAIWRLA